MDNGAYMNNNTNNGKQQQEQQQQQWGYVKEETFSSNNQFQWPAKNYGCNFCKREFKSAQALGGHMNVHRRDRARMRLLPSWVADNNNNNNHNNYYCSYPNPNISNFSPSCFNFRSSNKNSLSSSSQDQEIKKAIGSCSWNNNYNPSLALHDQDQHHVDDEVLHVLKKKKKNLVNLELKMGNLGDDSSNEELDLELHL